MFSLSEVTGLVAQMMHDLISPFSAISAGIEMTPSPGDEVWALIFRSKQQLTELLEIFRDFFGSETPSIADAKLLLKRIFKDKFTCVMPSDALIEVYPRITLGLCFWLVKQAVSKKGAIEIHNTPQHIIFSLAETTILPSCRQDLILMQGKPATSGVEYYAYFVYQLLKEAYLQVHVIRSNQGIVLHLKSKNDG
ncbi:hypothetical protein HE1_00085 [Holospora elegans E1]|uniref:Histidine phosphotransferase ChpT C-terminal domain-containing protein n=1 Tax=Holospora elegans E1 TaxID=1427503 RepID=A0A023DWR5_9PROT|nr:hypothetical protein [Holospora elegans]GAJ45776.1 hypothetical protein HE1_00085 [Holospora elegans E1]